MHNFISQPENLSASEWQLLQLLATYSGSFYAEEVFRSQKPEVATDNDLLKFYRHFHHIKHCSYVDNIPLENGGVNSNTRPLYKLSAAGVKATRPRQQSIPQTKLTSIFK